MQQLGDQNRVPGQTFESCPAATGPQRNDDLSCGQFPDRSHRCGEARAFHTIHRCTCGAMWQVMRRYDTGNRFRGETK